jgi:hypothetical protein
LFNTGNSDIGKKKTSTVALAAISKRHRPCLYRQTAEVSARFSRASFDTCVAQDRREFLWIVAVNSPIGLRTLAFG